MTTRLITDTAAEVEAMSPERQIRLYAVLARDMTYPLRFDVNVINRSQVSWVLDEITQGGGTYNGMESEVVLDIVECALAMACSVRVGRQSSPVVIIKTPASANDQERAAIYSELATMATAAYADEISLEIHDRTEAWYEDGEFKPTDTALESTKSLHEKYPGSHDGEWRPNFMTDLRLWWD